MIFFTTLIFGSAAAAFAGSVSVIGVIGEPLMMGVAVAVAVFVCCTPTSGAAYVAEQDADSPGSSAVGVQVIGPGIMSSETVTLSKRVEPLLKTVKVTFIVEPGTTSTPGAVFASCPLIFFTTYMPGRTAAAYAGSVSRTTGTGLPVTRSIIRVPSESTGVPTTFPVLVCCVSGAGATKVPVQVIDSPIASEVCGHEIAAAARTESVTATESSRVFPEFVTRKETLTVSPVTICGPGAVLASSPLRNLTMVMPGFGSPQAWASLASVTSGCRVPSVKSGGVPVTVAVSECCTPAAGAG